MDKTELADTAETDTATTTKNDDDNITNNNSNIKQFKALTPIPENIPSELKAIPQWVVFKAVKETKKDGSIRWTKPPLQKNGKTFADINIKNTWCSFDEAIKAMCFDTTLDGIGFVLTKDNGYTGIDLDHCIDADGNLSIDAQNIIKDINSYTEKSPSGTGIRIFCKGNIPDDLKERKNPLTTYEIYDDSRYLTITGHHIQDTPLSIESRPDEIKRFHKKYIQKSKNSPQLPLTSKTSTEEGGKTLLPSINYNGDAAILERAFKSKNGIQIQDLMNGKSTSSDDSANDLALCNHLAFWFNKDYQKIDMIFRQSGLFRADKWDTKHSSDGRTYGQMTIEKAIAGTHNTFTLQQSNQKFPETQNQIKSISANELLQKHFDPIKWAIPEILAEGIGIFAGKPKQGKSIMALDFAVSIATGNKALEFIKVQKGSVLYLALEDTERRLKDRLGKITTKDDSEALKNLHILFEFPKMDNGGLVELDKKMEAIPNLRLVIIDTLKMFRPSNNKKKQLYDIDYETISETKRIADKHKVSVLFIHHTRKTESTDIMDTFSGSFGLTGAADTLIALERKTGKMDAVLHITGRDVGSKEFALKFNQENPSWTLLGNADDVKTTQKIQKIFDVLKESSEAMTPSEIAEITELDKSYINKTLTRLAGKDPHIKKPEYGKYQYIETN